MISFDAKVEEKDLYKYSMHHTYTSFQGIASVVAALLIFASMILRFDELSDTQRGFYVLIVFIFLAYMPVNIRMMAKKQALQEVFSKPLHYEFGEDGIAVTSPTSEDEAVLPWSYIYKIVTWKDYLLIYSNRVNAYIIPRSEVDSQYPAIKEYIESHVEDYKLTLKWK